ncbi:MAG TPA: hypothetical protein VKY24_10725 [Reyranella sp.]|nr:hypothetical protein [Reyranella sp.]
MNEEKQQPEPEAFELPDTVDLAAVDAAEIEVIRLAAARRLTPLAALRFIRMLDHRRRVIADIQLEAKMNRLEQEPEEEEDDAWPGNPA